MKRPTTKTKEEPRVKLPTIKEQMAVAREQIEEVLDPTIKSKLMQLIASVPGIGKSYLVKKVCQERGIHPVPFFPANYFALVKHLYVNRNKPVIVLDDNECLGNDRNMISIIKMAFAPDTDRRVVVNTVEMLRNARRDKDIQDSTIPTGPFTVKSGLIWLSNTNYTDPKELKPSMKGHFDALISRGLDPMWIKPADDADLFNYTLELATKGDMLKTKGFKKSVQEQAISTFIKHRNDLQEISPRYLWRITDKINAGKNLGSMVLPEPKRSIEWRRKIPRLVQNTTTKKWEWK